MLSYLENYFYNKLARSPKNHPVYIIPTLDGMKVIALNMLLLVIGLVYANNYVLLFNFILFCLFISFMFYTHFNLNKLALVSFKFSSLFEEEQGILTLQFNSGNTMGHFFLRPAVKSPHLKIDSDKTFNISLDKSTISLTVAGIKRGKAKLDSLYIESYFPFHFFRCFTFYRINHELIVYPQKLKLNLHHETLLDTKDLLEAEDFQLKDYRPGDSLKRLDWKKLARTGEKLSKHRETEKPGAVMLTLNDKVNPEESLKSICFALLYYSKTELLYGIDLNNGVVLLPDRSQAHLINCLEKLAAYAA